ncbi:MAG: alpha/beta fold hydrolase [Planctomycetota bacterium]|nr:alpha/beta fold hydrolase [Planctomycetota bacterium]
MNCPGRTIRRLLIVLHLTVFAGCTAFAETTDLDLAPDRPVSERSGAKYDKGSLVQGGVKDEAISTDLAAELAASPIPNAQSGKKTSKEDAAKSIPNVVGGQKSAEATEKTKLSDRLLSATSSLAASKLAARQIHTDELLFREWRIQRNAIDGGYRLMDGDDEELARGTFEQCETKLREVKRAARSRPMKGPVVILLHGLGRTRVATDEMADFLKKRGQYDVLQFGYSSTREEIAMHAKSLARVIENLDSREIHFVAHSLGNLVIRHYLADHTDAEKGISPDKRIKRIVMVGPPNNGAHMAELVGRNVVFETVIGNPGQSLARGWDELEKSLVIPACEFGIIAGGKGDDSGFNPILQGDDDLIVSVKEAKLSGASDFCLVDCIHAKLMDDENVQKAALRFLRQGHFVSKKKKQPIE